MFNCQLVFSTSSEKYVSGGSDYVTFQLIIEREPLYFTFNIVLPILLLGLLNGFVFLLPAESGERVGTYVGLNKVVSCFNHQNQSAACSIVLVACRMLLSLLV